MMRALAVTASLTVALLLRWLLTDDDRDPTACPGGRLYDPAAGQFPPTDAPCLVLRRTWHAGELLVITTRRPHPLRDGAVVERTDAVPLTPRCRCCSEWRRSHN